MKIDQIGIMENHGQNNKLVPTRNIKQLGFSGLQAFVFQTNFSPGGYERTPKTQPFHVVKR